MAGELSRVTVVGARKQVDVAVPAATPIGQYMPRLARMCGQDRNPMLPPAWSLAVAGDEPYPPEASLAEMGVADGQVLYLRDLAREPGDPPKVEDLDELVEVEALKVRRELVWRGPGMLGFGLAMLLLVSVWLGLRKPAGGTAAICLTVVGLLLIGLAWMLGQRGLTVSRPLRLAVALTSVPCLAVAGLLVAESAGGPGWRWIGFVAGANLAALMALATIADAFLAVVAVQLATIGVAFSLLMWVDATPLHAAAFAVLASFGLFGVVRRVAATIAVWASRSMRTRPDAAAATGDLVHESGRIMVLLLLLPAGAMLIALPALAVSGNGFALALAVVGTIGLLSRAWLAGFPAEMLIFTGAGLMGAFSVFGVLTSMLSAPVSAAILVAGAVAVIGLGVGMSLFGPEDPTEPSTTKPPRRRTRAEVIGTLCNIVVAPLAMGAFGVLSDLVTLGRGIF
jgi:type VII secretion integral membrane protein EccD